MAIVLAARPLRFLAPLGRMAFTCYLAQSFILSFVFYGWGLGQFGRMSAAHGILLAIAIYAAQAIAAFDSPSSSDSSGHFRTTRRSTGAGYALRERYFDHRRQRRRPKCAGDG